MNRLIVILLILITVFSCKNEPEVIPVEVDTSPKILDLAPCSPDSSYFYNDVVPILVANCAFSGCHIALSLASYNDIINIGDVVAGDTTNSYLHEVITSTNPSIRMPRAPRPRLSDSQINVISKWIVQGAKPNACNDCNEQEFKFHANVFPLIVKNCQSCHTGANPAGNIAFNNYFQIKQQAENGKLLGSVKHLQGFKSMPTTGKLPACQIKVLENWINQGMLYD